MGAFTFGILGPLELRHEGGLVPLRGTRERAVLAALLLSEGRLVPLGRLIEAVWDGEPPQRADKAIRNAISALRGRFRQAEAPAVFIETDQAGYRLRLNGARLDAAAFTQLAASARELALAGEAAEAVEQLRAALSLWRGPALAGFGGLMLEAAAARLNDQRLAAWEECLELELGLGRHRHLTGELQELALQWPLRERTTTLLMLAQYRSGHQAEALEAYHRLARRLAEELGIDPSAEITQLHEAILRQDPELDRQPSAGRAGSGDRGQVPETSAAHTRPAQLPLDLPSFVGRERELAGLHVLLPPDATGPGAGTVVISAIGGTAGVGKTALAVRFAHQVADRFPDGQLYVNLQGFGPSGPPVTPEAALRGFLQALGVAPEAIPVDEAGQANLYRTMLAGRRVLVVLDNARDAAQVRPLLPGSPGSMVIVTSRSELTGLAATEGARLLILGMLNTDEAAELLAARLGQDRLDREPGAAEELASLCSGLPLALAIVAARVAARPAVALADTAGELLSAQSRLDALDTGDPATSVRAAFSWSYQQLTEPAARLFRLAGLHPGRDLTVPAAASLAGIEPTQARRLLDELVRSHLLSEHAPGRCNSHDLLRAYAVGLASAPDGADDPRAALTRLFDHYLATAAAAMRLLRPAEASPRPQVPAPATPTPGLDSREAALGWLEAERPVLVAVSAYAADHGWHRHAIDLAAVLHEYLKGGYPMEGMAVHGGALDAAEQAGDRNAQAQALRGLGTFHWRLGQYALARVQFKQALDLFQLVGDRAGEAGALNALGIIQWHLGDHVAAIQFQEQALDLFGRAGDRVGRGMVLANLGNGVLHQGRYREAAGYLREALTLARQDGDREGEGYALGSLGEVGLRSGQPSRAAGHFRAALGIFTELGHRTGRALTLSQLGDCETAFGRVDQATSYHQQALALFQAASDRGEEPFALNGLGEAAQAAGKPADALRHHAGALSITLDTGNREQQARAHAGIGRACEALGQPARAREHFRDALRIYTELGYPEANDIRARLGTSAAVSR